MDENNGLLAITILIVVLLALVALCKGMSKEKRNPFIVEIEEWLRTKDRKYKSYFEVDFPKKYREFKDWKENRSEKK
ncbi:hypothetical protein H206_01361 [Candidatus Electrothrix aarhusensis]|uniref:Uncharacterized protein n=1 Tax=Candidatus Electrothrix aarhusensis TaxID=1859131 RepID=A0A3S3QR15_9BACT|nr:hypothetical protein H206_01361 [Candidatus Electrothrix aarhusensis]